MHCDYFERWIQASRRATWRKGREHLVIIEITAKELLSEAPEIKINAISYTAGLEAFERARGDVEEHGSRRHSE